MSDSYTSDKDDCSNVRSLVEKGKHQINMNIYEDPIILSRDLDILRKIIQKPVVPPREKNSSTLMENLVFNAARNNFEHFIWHLRNRFADHKEYDEPADGSGSTHQQQPRDDDGDEPANGGNGGDDEPADESDRTHQQQPRDDDDDGDEPEGSRQQPPQGSSQRSPHESSQQQPHDATCSLSSTRHYRDSLPSPSQGLMDFVPYDLYIRKPMANYHGSKPCWSVAGENQTSDDDYWLFGTILFDWRLSSYSVCSPSRGLNDLIQPRLNNRRILQKVSRRWYTTIEESVNTRFTIPPGTVSCARFTGSCVENLTGSLVEISEVSANFPFVGTILVCDENSSKTVYYKDDWNKAHSDFISRKNKWISSEENSAVDFKDKLELTGPSRATTADGSFVIKACIPATKRKAREICKIVCNAGDSRMYNKVKTYIIKTDRGCIFVSCTVLPEALQASVIVKFHSAKCYPSAKVYGHITASIDKFGITSTLFCKDAKEAVPMGDFLEEGHYKIRRFPLTRSVLAVPFGEMLHIVGTVYIRGDDVPIHIDASVHIFFEEAYSSNVMVSLRPVF